MKIDEQTVLSSFDIAAGHIDLPAKGFIFYNLASDFFPGMQKSRMGFPSESRGKADERVMDHLFGKVHRHLPWKSDLFGAHAAFKIADAHIEDCRYAFEDIFDADFSMRGVLKKFAEGFFHNLFCDIKAHQSTISAQAINCPFELPDVVKDVLCNKEGDFLGDA